MCIEKYLSEKMHVQNGKFSSKKKISLVLSLLVVHWSWPDKEELSIQGSFFKFKPALTTQFIM